MIEARCSDTFFSSNALIYKVKLAGAIPLSHPFPSVASICIGYNYVQFGRHNLKVPHRPLGLIVNST